MSNVPDEQQCWFKNCRFRGNHEVAYRGMYVKMCTKHATQFKTSHEKQTR